MAAGLETMAGARMKRVVSALFRCVCILGIATMTSGCAYGPRALAGSRLQYNEVVKATSEEELRELQRQWAERGIPVALTVVESKYRDITGPILDRVTTARREAS